MAIVDKRGTDGFPAAISDIPTAALTQGVTKYTCTQVHTQHLQVL